VRALALLLLLALLPAACAAPQLAFVTYGQELCPACAKQKAELEVLRSEGYAVVYVEVNASTAPEFYRLYQLLAGGEPVVPLTLICSGGKLVAAAVGVHRAGELLDLAAKASGESAVLVSAEGAVKRVTDENAVREAQRIVEARLAGASPAVTQQPLSVGEVLPLLLALAVSDSVKPCTFIVFATTLLVVTALSGKRGQLASSLAFVAAVYACYYALGAGLVAAASALPSLFMKAFAALGLVFGLYLAAANARGKFKSLVPGSVMRRLMGAAETAPAKLPAWLGAAAVGALCALLLTPCGGGPLLVSAALLSRLPQQEMRYLLLALYNLVYVAPLLAIAAAASAASAFTGQIGEKKLAYAQALAGALLAATCLYLLVAY
jgi:cytochrome c biogenesis protein CcdA